MLRGFGKNYFTFASVLAHSVQNKLKSQTSIATALFYDKISQEDDALEEEELALELLLSTPVLSFKSCHCNCFYKSKTKLALLLNHFIPRCSYYTVCFAFRRSGVHPPL